MSAAADNPDVRNEYFLPKNGIDREVISTDICHYLGNDALIRPGNYENPKTREVQQGYFITAFRGLTAAMVAELKANSARWDAERRQTANKSTRDNPSDVKCRTSFNMQSRSYYVGHPPISETTQSPAASNNAVAGDKGNAEVQPPTNSDSTPRPCTPPSDPFDDRAGLPIRCYFWEKIKSILRLFGKKESNMNVDEERFDDDSRLLDCRKEKEGSKGLQGSEEFEAELQGEKDEYDYVRV